MTKKITCELRIAYVPLPPEKVFAYNEAHRLLQKLMLKAWLARKQEESHLAEDGSVETQNIASQVHPWAGVTTPSAFHDSSLESRQPDE